MIKKIPLLFSDVSFGTDEYGFIPRKMSSSCDAEDIAEAEDFAYQRHLKAQGIRARVVEGTVHVQCK